MPAHTSQYSIPILLWDGDFKPKFITNINRYRLPYHVSSPLAVHDPS